MARKLTPLPDHRREHLPFTVTYMVYTPSLHYADMEVEEDAVAYARKLHKRYPGSIVWVHQLWRSGTAYNVLTLGE
jgi:hypothetical protein